MTTCSDYLGAFHRAVLRGTGLLALLASLASSLPAHAGRSCEAPHPPQLQSVQRSLNLASRTQAALDASGQQVVVLARAGQDLSKYGLHYSHLGFAYRQPQVAPDGKPGHVWRVMHKLNQCGTPDGSVYRQGLGEFFLDDLWRFEAAWVAPTREVQDRLLPLLLDSGRDGRALSLHHRPYSVVSYAWGRKYQQSNQWAIETLALAMEPGIRSREQAQAWLQFKAYEPTPLKLGALTRLGARATAANVAFDDHPNEKRFSDRIETVTVDSVFVWMQRAGLSAAPVTLRQP
ncbi:MAG TPA: DUF2145 domain-containing protein [Polaromonas sp.]|uniref:DUF2145 domain-containing protein n=1 Tax=Polaromonas sp. TaxID=1869339 RepID=UPI002D585F4E|nr:DUF2145 domain-containing protein [Polaromonas sp.]HYW57090.1 DUF2145 domain-containing protein [Polaromonas sp.]